MAPKKKKKGKKKKEKKEGDEEENKEELNPAFNIVLPEYGWIRIELQLCDPPSSHNGHIVVMRSSDRILELKKRIIEYHGRIDDIAVYNRDPIPSRDPNKKMRMDKPRVPPYASNTRLRALYKEKTEKDEKAELKAKKRAKALEENKEAEVSEDSEPEVIKNDDPFSKALPVDKYEELKHWDFPVYQIDGSDIFEYNTKELSLYEIFGEYGTAVKPNIDPKKDPEKPEPKPPKVVKPITPPKPKEDEDEEGEGAEVKPPVVEEEPEEEVFIPPVHRTLFYDFSTYKNSILKKEDPILLALMVKGVDDIFTL